MVTDISGHGIARESNRLQSSACNLNSSGHGRHVGRVGSVAAPLVTAEPSGSSDSNTASSEARP